MPSPHCFGSIQACYLRWADVLDSGAPDPGADNGYITDALIQLGVTVEVSAGADVEQKNGCGSLCQAFRQPDIIKSVALTTELCHLDAELIQLMVGGTVFVDAGDARGYELPLASDPPKAGGVLEVWSRAWDSESQAQLGGLGQWFQWIFPRTRWTPGAFTLEDENFLAFPLSGFGVANPNVTANGPYNDWPLFLSGAGGVTAPAGFIITDFTPTPQCGYVTVPVQV